MSICSSRKWGLRTLCTIAFALCLSPVAMAQGWMCGDVDVSQAVDIADLSYVVDYLFFNGPAPTPYLCRGDWTGDATVDISDLNAAIDYLFFMGAPPPLHCCHDCSFGYANCNNNDLDGCELLLNSNPSCGSNYTIIPTIYGDASCYPASAQHIGTGEEFFRLAVADCPDACIPFVPENFGITVELTPPTGTDYDLYLYDDACRQLGSSTNGGSTTDRITYRYSGTCMFVDDSRYFRIEIRLYSASEVGACSNWYLSVYKNPAPVSMQLPETEAQK
jgi:hypothetical protein